MPHRIDALRRWLVTTQGVDEPELESLKNDASFRRYFRVMLEGQSYIVMDAPPGKENCAPFIDIAQRLLASGVNVPRIIASDLRQGFLLLTDLGTRLYLPSLKEVPLEVVDKLYKDSLQALLKMQLQVSTGGLPPYDHQLLHTEMSLFTDWLMKKHLNLSLSEQENQELMQCFERLSQSALSQPQVFVHRDYHSRNLMVTLENNPGILDFQDAVVGAITYDLVSLLRDCYIAWPMEQVSRYTMNFYQLATEARILQDVDKYTFLRWFDWMGIQRHLKASGIFARLYHRDGKSGYLPDIPRTLRYIISVGQQYPELSFLHELIRDRILPSYLETLNLITD